MGKRFKGDSVDRKRAREVVNLRPPLLVNMAEELQTVESGK